MPTKGTEAKVRTLPKCDRHPNRDAHYDFATSFGPWMYGCKMCFLAFGRGLGTGRGQVLVVSEDA